MDEYQKIDDTTMKVTSPVEEFVTLIDLRNQLTKLQEKKDYFLDMIANLDAEISKVQTKITEAGKLGIVEPPPAEGDVITT